MTVPVPNAPIFKLPAGSCDTHCHIFGPQDRFPIFREGPNESPEATKEALGRTHEILGVDRAVIVHTPAHGPDHSIILDAIASGNGRYRGVGRPYPEISDAVFEDLHQGGVRGMRYELLERFGPVPSESDIRRMADQVKGLGWHLLILLDTGHLPQVASLIQSLPVPVVIDHMARIDVTRGLDQPDFQLLLRLLEEDQIWVKLTAFGRLSKVGPPYSDVVPYAAKLVEHRLDRVMWGTDWPHPGPSTGGPPDDAVLVNMLPEIAPDARQRQAVLADNPATLYGFDT